MQVTFKDDLEQNQSKSYAFLDAKKTNAENINLYTLAEIQEGEELRNLVRSAYPNSNQQYLDYRVQRQIRVKVNKPIALDKLSDAVHTLHKFCTAKNYGMEVKQSSRTYIINF